MSFFERVYTEVRKIPKGKVATYGQIAAASGSPRAARQVGWALHCNPYFGEVPCHRVVFKDGSLTKGFAFGGIENQAAMLKSEGVEVSADFKVDIKKFIYEVAD